jgi:hypothetical protein
MSPEMKTYWLSQIAETRSLPALAADDLALFMGVAGAPLAGLIGGSFYLSRRWREAEGWVLLGFLLAGWALLAWQIRGGFFAVAFAIPFGAWATARARQAWKIGSARSGILVFLAAAASSAPAAWSAVGEQIRVRTIPAEALHDFKARAASADDCTAPQAYAALRSIDPGVMFNNFMLGHGVLQWTSHSVIAAPYHRDADGLMKMITAMRSNSDAAKPIVMGTAADYVLVCGALPEVRFSISHPKGDASSQSTLATLLVDGTAPDWLTPIPLADTPLRLYRIVR